MSRRKLSIELLEQRLAPAVIVWDGGAGGTGNVWHDPVNWVGNVLPGPNDDAVIGSAGPTIGLNGFAETARTVTSVRTISLSIGSSLRLGAGQSQFSNLLFESSSILDVADGTILHDSAFTFQGSGAAAVAIGAGETVELTGTSDLNIGLTNAGTLIVRGTPRIDGAFSNQAGATTRVIGGTGGSTLQIANGFTNAGTIELTSNVVNAGSTFRVVAGTLLNAPSGSITTLVGSGGNRRLEAILDHRGALSPQTDLTIDVAAGTSISSGSMTVPAGVTLRFADPLDYLGGAIGGGGSVAFQGLTLTAGLAVSGFSMSATAGTIAGPGTLTVAGGQVVTLQSEVVNAPLSLAGSLTVQGACTINSPLTVPAGSTLRVEAVGTAAGGLTVGQLSNQGTIELAGGAIGSLAATLLNSATGTIRSLASGAPAATALIGAIDNQGLIQADAALRISGIAPSGSPSIINSGTIRAASGPITLNRFNSGIGRGPQNNGTFAVSAGQNMTISAAPANFSGTTLTGGQFLLAGPLQFPGANVLSLAANLTLDGALSNIVNSTTGTTGIGNLATVAPGGSLTIRNRTFTLPAALASSGLVTLGSGGVLATTAGAYTQSTGTTTIESGGTLDPSGGATIVGGTVRGGGAVAANLQVNIGGTASPGLSPGEITVNGNVDLGGTYRVELNGTTPGTQYDRLIVSGAVGLGGTLNLTAGFTPANATVFRIIDNDGSDAVTGAFTNAANNATLSVGGLTFQISYTGGTGNDVTLTRITPPAPPQVAEVAIDDGSVQRSRVASIQLTFDAVVTLVGGPAAPFELLRDDGGSVGFTATPQLIGGVTVVRLDNFTGAATQFGSLADGRYRLSVNPERVTANGLQLDGNGNGTGGDGFTIDDSDGLFRFFGDMNGDRRIDISDFGQFSSAHNRSAGDPLFNTALDFNHDGRIDIADFGQFSTRFFTTLP